MPIYDKKALILGTFGHQMGTMKSSKIRKNGKDAWKVDFRVAGKRQRVFFTTEAAAESFLASKRKEVDQLGVDALNITHAQRSDLLAAERLLEPFRVSVLDAVRSFVASRVKAPMDLGAALEECVKSKESSGKRKTYVKNFKNALKRFIRGRESEMCSDINRKQIESWLDKHAPNPATRKSIQADIQTFFSFALKRGWVVSNPCNGIEPVLLDQRPPCIFTVKQAQLWIGAIRERDPLLTAYFALGLFAGLRPAEIKNLKWEDVNLDSGFVQICSAVSKTRRRRIVHLSTNCVEWLRLAGGLPRIHARDRITKVRKTNTYLAWGHDIMRHSFASYHLALHESADKTALEMGNSPQILFAHYRELVNKHDAEEFFKIMPA